MRNLVLKNPLSKVDIHRLSRTGAPPTLIDSCRSDTGDTLRADFVKVQSEQERGPGEAGRRERLRFAAQLN